jgi:predicted RecA/RadA family phage recombinase
MKTKFGNGKVLTVTAPSGGVVSGRGVLIGSIFGIAVVTAAAGETVAIDTAGEFDHTAAGAGSGQAWALGDAVYWDNTAKALTKTSTDNTKVGVATAAKLTAAVEGRFKIIPFA